LLPEDDIIQQYYNALTHAGQAHMADRKSFPDIPDCLDFRYLFIPLQGMESIALHRQNIVPAPDTPLSADDFTTHTYPFATLPLMTSHLHPKFVILEAGRKLETLETNNVAELIGNYPSLGDVVVLYGAWTRAVPSNAMVDRTYNNPDEDDGSDNDDEEDNNNDEDYKDNRSQRTSHGRYGSRRWCAPHGSPTPSSKRPRREGGTYGQKRKHSSLISGVTMVEHSRKVGKMAWTDDAVRNWSTWCQPLPAHVHRPWG